MLRLLMVLVAGLAAGLALAAPAAYGKPVQFYMGKPVVFADLEVTFDGGGSLTDAQGNPREYRAFRVVSRGQKILVPWYADQTKPVDFQIAGRRFRLQVVKSSNPRADGALTVWKR
ncbi:MAG: hypothetical protein SFU83_13505 [Meiothermus sp.]|nr:hypothetical protein [Meiothermus sp.]